MKFILEINNKTAQKISKKKILDIFKHTLKLVDIECLQNKDFELSVAFVNEDEIRKLNKQYRKKNSATDVLSFSDYETTQDLCEEASVQIMLGELILCSDIIEKNALEDGESFEYALHYIVSHGILHLLGLDHGKKMFDLQKKVANELIVV